MMMALCSISDPGLVLLPTHRIVKQMAMTKEEALRNLSTVFDLDPIESPMLMGRIEELQRLGQRSFGLAFEGGEGYVLTERETDLVLALNSTEDSVSLKDLDVTVLHRVILEKLLNVVGLDQIAYTRDAQEAVRATDAGAAAAFLMNPPSVNDMQTIALGGDKMPQKSTYYYPKILSGLVLWSLNDF